MKHIIKVYLKLNPVFLISSWSQIICTSKALNSQFDLKISITQIGIKVEKAVPNSMPGKIMLTSTAQALTNEETSKIIQLIQSNCNCIQKVFFKKFNFRSTGMEVKLLEEIKDFVKEIEFLGCEYTVLNDREEMEFKKLESLELVNSKVTYFGKIPNVSFFVLEKFEIYD